MIVVVMLQVVWGEASMIEAERLLLRAALENPANHRFILLSDRYIFMFIIVILVAFIESVKVIEFAHFSFPLFRTVVCRYTTSAIFTTIKWVLLKVL